MIKTTINVLGHSIECELSTTVPISEWKMFKKEMEDDISDCINSDIYSGTLEMFYTEGEEDECIDTDVDVKWKIVNPWMEVAKELYIALEIATEHDGGYNIQCLSSKKLYKETVNNLS